MHVRVNVTSVGTIENQNALDRRFARSAPYGSGLTTVQRGKWRKCPHEPIEKFEMADTCGPWQSNFWGVSSKKSRYKLARTDKLRLNDDVGLATDCLE